MNRIITVSYYDNILEIPINSSIRDINGLKGEIKNHLSIAEKNQILDYGIIDLKRFLIGEINSITIKIRSDLSLKSLVPCYNKSWFSDGFNKEYFSERSEKGFYKFGLNIDKYGGNKWLTKGDSDEWKMKTYHGTSLSNAFSIIQKGYLLSHCKVQGIYSTTDFKTALQYTAKNNNTTLDHKYIVVLKNRIASNHLYNSSGIYITYNELCIRPYAMIIKSK